jgi:hypothetical protein
MQFFCNRIPAFAFNMCADPDPVICCNSVTNITDGECVLAHRSFVKMTL